MNFQRALKFGAKVRLLRKENDGKSNKRLLKIQQNTLFHLYFCIHKK